MGFLPPQLQRVILWEVRTPILSPHPLFSQLDIRFPLILYKIIQKAVTVQIIERGEAVFRQGDFCEHMIFLVAGQLQYGVKDSDVDTLRDGIEDDPFESGETLFKGMWLCEPAIWIQHWINQGKLVTNTGSVLFSLERVALRKATKLSEPAYKFTCSYATQYASEMAVRDESTLSDVLETLVN